MLVLAEEYVDIYGWEDAVNRFVNDLMRGDEATFKQGYTKENAIIATAEAFDLNVDQVRDLLS